jgi:dGTPase
MNYAVHDLSTLILRFYSSNLINNSTEKINELIKTQKINNETDFYKFKNECDKNFNPKNLISFDNDFIDLDRKFQKYLINRILNSHLAQTMDGKASHVLRIIIEAYLTNPKQLPDGTIISLLNNFLSKEEYSTLVKGKKSSLVVGIMREKVDELHNANDDKFKSQLIRTITDFIAGMTDKYAISQYRMLYGSDNYWMK